MTKVKLFEPPKGPIQKPQALKNDTFKPKPTRISGEVSLDKVVTSIIANQMALNANEALKYTEYYKHELKQAAKKLNEILIKAEFSEYDKIYDSESHATSTLYEVTDLLLKQILKVNIRDYNELKEIVEAYTVDPKSVSGIAKKVLKQKS